MMFFSRGTHQRLQRLPHSLMKLNMELNSFDGSFAGREANDKSQRAQLSDESSAVAQVLELPDDPIESFD